MVRSLYDSVFRLQKYVVVNMVLSVHRVYASVTLWEHDRNQTMEFSFIKFGAVMIGQTPFNFQSEAKGQVHWQILGYSVMFSLCFAVDKFLSPALIYNCLNLG